MNIALHALLGAGLCLGISLFSSFLWDQKPGSKKYPEGPRTWPLLGNLLDFAKILKNPDQELINLAQEYGSIYMLWFVSKPVLVISSPADVKELLDKKGAIYSDRPSQNIFQQRALPQRLVTIGVGEDLRLMRRIFSNLLGPKQSESLRRHQNYESTIALRDLANSPGEFLDHMERYAMSVIFSAVYGVRLESLNHHIMTEFYDIWGGFCKYFQPGTLPIDYFPILQRLPESLQPWVKFADNLRTREAALHMGFFRTLKKQIETGVAPECFGVELVKVQETENIDDQKAMNMLAMLISAGSDTTSSVLQTFFKVMALNTHAVRDAQEELDRVVGPCRLPTWQDEQDLPYLRALIKEVHRYAPIGTLGIPHATSEEDTYRGRTIPKGTTVFPSLSALSRDPSRYAEPDAFKPERFMGDNLGASASAKHPDFRQRDHFHYGFGRRICQGIHVAEASLYIVIARVLWAFDIAPEDGEPPLRLQDKMSGLINKPKPYRVRITPRSDAARQVIEDSAKMAQTDILGFDSVEWAD